MFAFGVVIIGAIVTRNALRRIGVTPPVAFVVIGLAVLGLLAVATRLGLSWSPVFLSRWFLQQPV